MSSDTPDSRVKGRPGPVYSLLLAIIYIAFVSLGLPDSLIGAGWPVMHEDLGVPVAFAGIITMIIAGGTILSSLASERLTRRFGAGAVTAVSVGMTAAALLGFSTSGSFWMLCLWAIPYSVFYVVALAWIPVYAIFTVHKSGWLTRQITGNTSLLARLLPATGAGFWRQAPMYATAGLTALVVGSGSSFWMNQPALLPVRVALSLAQAESHPGPDFSIRPASATGQVLAYTHLQDGQRRWRIAAAGSHFDQENGTIDLRGVEMVFYTKDGGQIRLSSDQGEYDPSDHSLSLVGNVQGTTSTGIHLATNSLNYSQDDLTADTDDEVTLSGPTFKVRGRGILLDVANNKTVFKKAVSSRISSARGHSTLATLGS